MNVYLLMKRIVHVYTNERKNIIIIRFISFAMDVNHKLQVLGNETVAYISYDAVSVFV